MVAHRNAYQATCADCRAGVAAEGGYLDGKDTATNRWRVLCPACHGKARIGGRSSSHAGRRPSGHASYASHGAHAGAYVPPRHGVEVPPRYATDAEVQESLERLKARLAELEREEWQRARVAALPACLRTLGLMPPVDMPAVRLAYRSLAFQHHPDRGGNSQQFIAVEGAYREAVKLVERAGGRWSDD